MTKVEIEGDSEEAVAFALLQMVAEAEGRVNEQGRLRGVDRDWILDTYTECLMTVMGERLLLDEEDAAEDDEDGEEEDEEAEPEEDEEEERPGRAGRN